MSLASLFSVFYQDKAATVPVPHLVRISSKFRWSGVGGSRWNRTLGMSENG